MQCTSVDLPAPFGPIRHVSPPAGRANDRSCTARTASKLRETDSTVRAGAAGSAILRDSKAWFRGGRLGGVAGPLTVPGRRGHATLAQAVLLDLAARRDRQLGQDVDVARDGKVGQARLAEPDELDRIELDTLAGDDAREHLVLAELRRHRDDGCARDVGVREQRLLDLVRRDVLAAAPDRILQPVDETEAAVAVADDAVARVEPEVSPRRSRRFGQSVVPGGEGRRLAVAH